MLRDVEQLLHTAAYHPIEIDTLLDPERPSFLQFDPELGYIVKDYVFRDGIYDTLSNYLHEAHGGHRTVINGADQPCRINTYGNSFTQCAQVSDGETWQEVLAAHIREPIRNFGVGGYGVYQAYLRAMRTEVIDDLAADHIILNVWDDDHLRNIDAARWIRVAWTHRALPRGEGADAYPVHGFPWCHLRYNLESGDFVECPGLCKDEDDLRKLADRDYYYQAFKDDEVAHLFTLREGGEAPTERLQAVAAAFGLDVNLADPERRIDDATKLHWAYGMRGTRWIIDTMRAWAEAQGRRLMVILSYDTPAVKTFVETGERFDDDIVRYLQESNVPYADCLLRAAEEYKQFSIPVEQYLERFYIPRAGAQVFGHYSPHGNFWFAWAIRGEVVDWLDPKPPAYRTETDISW